MNTNDYIADINQNISNVNAAEAFAQAASTSLSNSTTIISNVQQLAVQGANGTESASDLQALGTQVNEDLESLVQNANSQFGGSYMFSGTDTNTAPIAVTRDAQGNIQSVTYQGSDNEMEYPHQPGIHGARQRHRQPGLRQLRAARRRDATPERLEQHAGTQQPGPAAGAEQRPQHRQHGANRLPGAGRRSRLVPVAVHFPRPAVADDPDPGPDHPLQLPGRGRRPGVRAVADRADGVPGA